jgi:UDP-2,4-diacetamido-2,4,6-trideoxy-beta-L-altropyranose hydrolase
MGLGHIVRCMALAQMLQNDFEVSFVCREIPADSEKELVVLGFRMININHEEDFLALLSPGIIVVLDHYGLDSNYQKVIKEKGCKLVCIDDLHDKVFFADLIINHGPNIKASDYKAQIYTKYALGLDYVLLRPAFFKEARRAPNNREIKTVFVCFGGSDAHNITQVVVDVLKDDKRVKKIIVVAGAAYAFFADLKRSIFVDKRFLLYHSVGANTMANLISEAQLAIVPASGILQEVMAIGCRIISGMYAENQKYIFDDYKNLGAFESAGDFSKQDIIKGIDKIIQNGYESPKRYIDLKSRERLLKCFKQFQIEDKVFLRAVNKDDLLKTFEWANNGEIRKFFFNNKPITFEEHSNWFINNINNKQCLYYIAVLDNEKFGSIRFEIKEGFAVISYLVDPIYQQNGLGVILLDKGLDLFSKECTETILYVYGEVLTENIASIKTFKKLGYVMEPEPSGKIVKFKKYISV